MKKEKNKLLLEKRGGDFYDNFLKEKSDIHNYRVTTPTACIIGKDGFTYFLEFTIYAKYFYRYNNLKTGKTLKKPVKELKNIAALHVDTCYEKNGISYRNIQLEKELTEMELSYNKKDILKAVNYISSEYYNDIIFIDYRLMIEKAGYREKAALLNGEPQYIQVGPYDCIKYNLNDPTYSYADGSIWCVELKKWIN